MGNTRSSSPNSLLFWESLSLEQQLKRRRRHQEKPSLRKKLFPRRATKELQHLADSQLHLVQPHASQTPVSQVKCAPREVELPKKATCVLLGSETVQDGCFRLRGGGAVRKKMTSGSSREENGVIGAEMLALLHFKRRLCPFSRLGLCRSGG